MSGNARKLIGSLRDFVRDQPVIAAGLALVIGLALTGGLRGRQSR
jgi:hypothetical protein